MRDLVGSRERIYLSVINSDMGKREIFNCMKRETGEWIKIAEEDFQAAEHLFERSLRYVNAFSFLPD